MTKVHIILVYFTDIKYFSVIRNNQIMSTISKTYIRRVKLGNIVWPTSRILLYRISGSHNSLKQSDLNNGGHPVGFCTLQPRKYINRFNALNICSGLSTKHEIKINKNQSYKETGPGKKN